MPASMRFVLREMETDAPVRDTSTLLLGSVPHHFGHVSVCLRREERQADLAVASPASAGSGNL